MENEMIGIIEQLRLENETYYEGMREEIWRRWKSQDERLLKLARELEQKQENMAEDILKAQNDR